MCYGFGVHDVKDRAKHTVVKPGIAPLFDTISRTLMLFLFSGIMSRSVLLIIASVLFAPSHIVISYKNVK